MFKHAVKKLPYLLRYFRDQYKTQQVCYKGILENVRSWLLQKSWNKVVDNYPGT